MEIRAKSPSAKSTFILLSLMKLTILIISCNYLFEEMRGTLDCKIVFLNSTRDGLEHSKQLACLNGMRALTTQNQIDFLPLRVLGLNLHLVGKSSTTTENIQPQVTFLIKMKST